MPLDLIAVKSLEDLLPARGPEAYPAGIKDYDKGFVKYGPASSGQPNLVLPDPIYDLDGNVILPGYYELALSYDRKMLILSQSGKAAAVIPVIKIEETYSQEQVLQPMSDKELNKIEKKKKKEEKKKQKELRKKKKEFERMNPGEKFEQEEDDLNQLNMSADIEFDVGNNYYLIKYEKGNLKAWGILKTPY